MRFPSTRRLLIGLPILLSALPLILAWVLRKFGADRLGLKLAARVQQFWARLTLVILGVRLDAPGKPPRGAFVLTANHLSYIDVLVLAALFPSRFIAKSEIAGWPVIGFIVGLSGTLFVKRGDHSDVPRMVKRMRNTLDAGVGITFFPEGWASRGLTVKRFHAGLLQSAVEGDFPCLPVALSYSTPDSPFAPAWTVAWWSGSPLGAHLLRMIRLGPVVARVRWAPEPLWDADRKQLATRLHGEVLARFVPLDQDPLPPPMPGDPLASEGLD
jgi:1-acyl-sn-glycerol-3-phosphate acyltransferase